MDIGNLISCSSAFPKTSLNIWKFSVHILLKPSLKDFEHYLASMWKKLNCVVIWTFFVIALLWDWNENLTFPVLWSDVQAGFRKSRGTTDQIANIHWIIEKAREFQKNIYFCFIDYTRDFDSVITTNWNILQDMGITDHLTCLLRNLYIGWLRSNS